MTSRSMSAGSGPETPPPPARQASLREHNLRLVLNRIAYSSTTPSRAEVAQSTGLTRATVSALVDQLILAGLVAELPLARSQKAGRPASPLVIATATMAAVGLEINVDYLGIRILDLAGGTLAECIEPGDYRTSSPERVLAAVSLLYASATADLLRQRVPVIGICVALPGLVDTGAGPLRVAPNLGWREVDVAAGLRNLLELDDGTPITLANEAKLAARAELEVLRPTGIHSFFYVSGEIGIGGAIVRDGNVTPGGHGWNGEIGHTLVDPAGPQCGCGAQGCLERYAGQDALFRQAGLDVNQPISVLMSQAAGGSVAVLRSFELAGVALGVALANAINLIDIDTVILGGIYAPLADYLAPHIAAQLQLRVLWQSWAPVRLQAARAGEHTALTGAALSVLGAVLADPSSWVEFAARHKTARRT